MDQIQQEVADSRFEITCYILNYLIKLIVVLCPSKKGSKIVLISRHIYVQKLRIEEVLSFQS
jgi:F0F1-type ATP synthase beta subunit